MYMCRLAIGSCAMLSYNIVDLQAVVLTPLANLLAHPSPAGFNVLPLNSPEIPRLSPSLCLSSQSELHLTV